MTVRDCYELINGDYEDVKRRFLTDARIQRFALLFLKDGSMEELRTAMAAGECENAFHAAHTLKGVCLNLGFTGFGDIVSRMTELLRAGNLDEAAKGLDELECAYAVTFNGLRALEEG